jgi:hypothetical protein
LRGLVVQPILPLEFFGDRLAQRHNSRNGRVFVSPRRIASIAASLILSGVSKSGSPTDRLMHVAPLRFQLARLLRDRDRRGRLYAGKGVSKKGHGGSSR